MTIQELIDRDGPNCGLCKQPVDLSFKYPHPLSATTGHIIPRDRDGSDDPGNLRLEHQHCNAIKHTRLDEELEPGKIVLPKAVLTEEEYADRRKRLIEGATKGGKNVSLEACIRGGQNYHKLLRGTPEYDAHRSKAGKRRVELHGKRISTPESCSKGGSTAGKINAQKLGFLQSIGLGNDGRIGPHVHWHVRRGIKNPNCELCQQGWLPDSMLMPLEAT